MDSAHMREIRHFWQSLAHALAKGRGLADALDEALWPPDVARIAPRIEALRQAVGRGTPFHEALRADPSLASETSIAVVEVNENAGDLSLAVQLVADALARGVIRSGPLTPGQ